MKASAGAFTRGGPLSPQMIVSLLLYLVSEGQRMGYKHLLNAFWDMGNSFGLELPCEATPSAAAFCKARKKIKSSAVRTLGHEVNDFFRRDFGRRFLFRGRRLLAVDGAKANLLLCPELTKEFGIPKNGHVPQAMITMLIDVLARTPLDATITKCNSSERDEFVNLLDRVLPGDIVILDRGYPSYELICQLQAKGIDFVMRVSTKGTFRSVETFMSSGRDEAIIELPPSRGSSRARNDGVSVRVVRRRMPKGEDQAFLTSLHSREFSKAVITEMYAKRWEAETFFRHIKAGSLEQGQFHAKSADGVRQEIYAVLLYATITRTLLAAASRKEQKDETELSMKNAVLVFGRYLTRLLLSRPETEARQYLRRVLVLLARCTEPKRPNRSFPRRSLKPGPRWGPNGRRGAAGREG